MQNRIASIRAIECFADIESFSGPSSPDSRNDQILNPLDFDVMRFYLVVIGQPQPYNRVFQAILNIESKCFPLLP